MASRWQAVKCLLDVGPQGKQLIELPLPQPESAGQLMANGTRSANQTRPHGQKPDTSAPIPQQWRLAENPQRDTPSASHAIPQLTTSETDFCIELGNKRCNFNRQSGFFQMWIGDENNC